jgi:carboxyl-terminal processing protease
MNKMKYILITFVIASLLFADETVKNSYSELQPETQHKRVTQLLAHLLSKNHYKKLPLDDSLSSDVFDRYLEKLDYNRAHFLKSDIESFEKYRYQFDDFLLAGHLAPAYEIFNVYQKRFDSHLKYTENRITQPFDFTRDEYLMIKREDAPWALNDQELQEVWRKRIKYQALDLKLAGKDSAGIIETLEKRHENLARRMSQYQSEDVYQLFMNSFSESYDPHTTYFSPKNFDNFKIAMSQSFEGIGARLTTRGEHTIVVEIITGGPADKSQDLHPNDKITAVGQGDDEELVDVIGWRIDDVVQLIRGKKSTAVRLQLIRADDTEDAPRDTLALVREKVNIEDQTAKSKLIEIEHEGRQFTFGVIDLPTFYSDFEGMRKGLKDYNSTTRDVKNLILEMDHSKVNGIIIDLRGNGGGFLNEAIDLTGLFIEKGPVVQVKNSTGKVDVEWDTDPSVIYDGPLAVLVDRISASASEIFAAAIQDYNRGIIIGAQTFGKGTVQNAIDLNRFMKSDPKLGQIKMTIAKFYRINGGSTQHVGVIPDVAFPSRYAHMDIGESSQPNALLWDQIKPVKYDLYGNIDAYIPNLVAGFHSRTSQNEEYEELLESIEKMRENQERTKISLNENQRREEREKNKEKKAEAPADSTNIDANDQDIDLMLTESGHILGDFILMKKEQRTGKK